MKLSSFNISAFLLLVVLMAMGSCQKTYEEPPQAEVPNLVANTTIAEVAAMAETVPVSLQGKILEGVVIADDRAGNFYKQIVIQDATAGIRIDIDAFSLYNEYPVGRKVYVKGDNLFVWKDGDVPVIVGSKNTNQSRIPQANYRKFIIGAETNQPVTPVLKTIPELRTTPYYTLIQLDNVEFDECSAGNTYAYPYFDVPEGRDAGLINCDANNLEIIVRNSGYAEFASDLMPTGNGSIIAVYSSYNGTTQLLIRDPNDVSSLTGNRCTPLGTYPDVSIADLRSQYTGSATQATGQIKGIVISDSKGGQWQDQNMVIQEPNGAGITVRFSDRDGHEFNVGQYVAVKVGGANLDLFNGLLQVNNVDLCQATALPNPTGLAITPRVTTVADLMANANDWESTLIKVEDAYLNGGTTYGDFGVMLNDPTGAVGLFSGFSNFANEPLPTGTGAVTAVVGNYNGTQLNIRDLYDVDIAGSSGTINQISIQDLRAFYTGSTVLAPDTTKISGIVISDHTNGNWQAQNLVIQEPNGAGIMVRFSSAHTYNTGDEVEVVVSRMSIEEYNGLLQVNGVPNGNASFISSGNSITPRVATIADIMANANAWESTLLNIQNATLTGTGYGDFNAMINDPTGSMSFFNAFGNFPAGPFPTGMGDVTAVLSDFTGAQLKIRSTADVNISGGGGGGPTTFITVGDVRNQFASGTSTVASGTSIGAIVISDKDAENITGRNVVVQQTNGKGIVLRFDNTNTTLSVGDSITVDISGGGLSEFNGLLQIDGLSNANAAVVSSNNTVAPRVATVADILLNAEDWESTLVVINGATITGSTTYSGVTSVTDATGTLDMYTRPAATFSGDTVPAAAVNITAIVSQFNNYQINIRNTSDVQ
jgi:hypothetical protein